MFYLDKPRRFPSSSSRLGYAKEWSIHKSCGYWVINVDNLLLKLRKVDRIWFDGYRILELQENGIFLRSMFLRFTGVAPPQCLVSNNLIKEDSYRKTRRLSLKDLTGAFVVLLIGYLTSIAAFLWENIEFRKNDLQKQKK